MNQQVISRRHFRQAGESPQAFTLPDGIDHRLFSLIYSRSLAYNTCWEDPAVDRQALRIGPSDRMLVISSAGCEVLNYALCRPARIHAVNATPRQPEQVHELETRTGKEFLAEREARLPYLGLAAPCCISIGRKP